MKRSMILAAAITAVVLGASTPAAAHVTPSVSEAPAGGYAAVTFRISHGCEGEGGDTERVEIRMPEGVETATPQSLPGWEATVDESGPVVVTFEGGPLPHDRYLEFGVSLQMPDTPGETAEFPTVQTCVSGDELAWVESTPEDGEEPEHPAPAVAITEAEGHGHGAGDADEAGDEEPIEAQAAAAVSEADDGTDPLAVVALVVGALGLLAGGYAVVATRRAS